MSTPHHTATIHSPPGREGDLPPFWYNNRAQLIVIFEPIVGQDGQARVRAHGIDPDKHWLAFWADLRSDQKDAFLAAVGSRAPASEAPEAPEAPVSPQSAGDVNHDTVVITDNGGDGPGPKSTKAYQLPPSDAAKAA